MASDEAEALVFVVDSAVIGKDALLKACYWYARDFSNSITSDGANRFRVFLSPKSNATAQAIADCKDNFLNSAIDFELRFQVEAKTASIRELILAKAFAVSGVLEEPPQGVFTDPVEESKPEGLFKILGPTRP